VWPKASPKKRKLRSGKNQMGTKTEKRGGKGGGAARERMSEKVWGKTVKGGSLMLDREKTRKKRAKAAGVEAEIERLDEWVVHGLVYWPKKRGLAKGKS